MGPKSASRLLIEAGFSNPKFSQAFQGFSEFSKEKQNEVLSSLDQKNESVKFADHDELELSKDQLTMVDYPKAVNKYRVVSERQDSIESLYFWSLGALQNDLGFSNVIKLTDVFAAAEQSSLYGASAQRLGLAQDKVTTFLATIGRMIKDMFQLVREIRIIDERVSHYKGAIEKKNVSDEVALKSLWIDLVDGVVGGQRTGANLFTMAQQLQFSSLPDLFFSIHPTTPEVVDSVVEKQAAQFNRNVREVLARKLSLYLRWRDASFKELSDRRRFTIDYLRQHFHVIKMYLNWVKPYLRHIQRLRGDVDKGLASPELISSFEGSLVDIEILATRLPQGNKQFYSCILLTFEYRTRPSLSFAVEGGFHRGPVHVGETKVSWRAYGWSEAQVKAFQKMKDAEDLEMIASVDQSVRDAMTALGDDLFKYLEELRPAAEPEKKEEQKPSSLLDPFAEIIYSFRDAFLFILPKGDKKKPKSVQEQEKAEKAKAEKEAAKLLYTHYKTFKKNHGMLAW